MCSISVNTSQNRLVSSPGACLLKSILSDYLKITIVRPLLFSVTIEAWPCDQILSRRNERKSGERLLGMMSLLLKRTYKKEGLPSNITWIFLGLTSGVNATTPPPWEDQERDREKKTGSWGALLSHWSYFSWSQTIFLTSTRARESISFLGRPVWIGVSCSFQQKVSQLIHIELEEMAFPMLYIGEDIEAHKGKTSS